MTKTTTVLLMILAGFGATRPAAAQEPGPAENVFDRLAGSWEGTGTLLGRDAVFTMRWERTDDGFVRLRFTNGFSADGVVTPVLTAEATYRPDGERGGVGVWIDSRPQQLTLDLEVGPNAMIVHWRAPSETGRTVYIARDDGTVHVTDYVDGTNGERTFAQALYRRSG